MKKRQGFVAVELPMALFTLGAVVIAVGVPLLSRNATVGWSVISIGAIFCVPLLLFLGIILFCQLFPGKGE